MPYELRPHTADVAVAAAGATLGETFAAVADGLAAAHLDDPAASPDGDRFDLAVTAESREALLFDYLDELIYERDVRGVLPVEHEATVTGPDSGTDSDAGANPDAETEIAPDLAADQDATGTRPVDGWTVSASYRGVALGGLSAREVKAVTYSEMELERTGDGWRAYVVFDV